MTKDESLRLALEALEGGVKTQANGLDWIEYDSELVEKAITAIEAALEAKDEPVAWLTDTGSVWKSWGKDTDVPLYTTPPQRTWEELTDDEMKAVCAQTWSYDPYLIARAIEAKLKEKNT
jgi:hypothetical protein